VGVVVTGDQPKQVVIRGVGPSMGDAVPTRLLDPELKVYRVNVDTPIGTNNDWGGGAELTNAFSTVGLAPLAANSKDAAMLATLQPGAYTVHVSGVGNTSGIALMEVYELP
jgi:hypothetical protein